MGTAKRFTKIGCAVIAIALATYSPVEALSECRYKVKFIKYVVNDTGGERKAETWVQVTVDGKSVKKSKRASKGETVTVGKTITTVTANSSGTSFNVTLHGKEIDLGTSGVISKEKVTLYCDKSLTKSWKVRSSGNFAYTVYVAFEKQ